MITGRLSSDILEEQFGPTTLSIVYQDNAMRVIQTTAARSGQVLELSLVRFVPEGVASFPKVHTAILAGESMGKAFRKAGIVFERKQQFAHQQHLPPQIHALFDNSLPATVISVRILVGKKRTPYAHITECYTGAASWPHLSGVITPQAQADLTLLAARLVNGKQMRQPL